MAEQCAASAELPGPNMSGSNLFKGWGNPVDLPEGRKVTDALSVLLKGTMGAALDLLGKDEVLEESRCSW